MCLLDGVGVGVLLLVILLCGDRVTHDNSNGGLRAVAFMTLSPIKSQKKKPSISSETQIGD